MRVIGIGQSFAGDDGVGPAVIERLSSGVPQGVELVLAREPSELIDLLAYPGTVVVVDAVLDPGRAGRVRVLELAEVEHAPVPSLSSHGLGVAQAIELCRTLYPRAVTPDLVVLAIGIDPPARHGSGLSPEVARGAVEAADWVRRRAFE
jgi:hydrogenase maturation protease